MDDAARFAVTFLGHQSWALDAGEGLVLVDPLLGDGMGDEPAPYLAVHPPREIAVARMPAVAAIVLTHEHPDHFHLPSLVRVPRRVPVYLSANASAAGRGVLRALGFEVRALRAGERIAIAGIEVLPQQPLGRTRADEWDVMPFLARDLAGHGSFFSTVDLTLDVGTLRALKAIEPRPGLWAVPNNDMDLSDLYAASAPSADQSAARARSWAWQLGEMESAWGAPESAVLYGGGFSFVDDLAWLNARAFDCDGAAAIAAMPPERGRRFVNAMPGDTFEMRHKRLVVSRTASWIEVAPRERWPARGASAPPRPPVDLFAPSRARPPLDLAEQRALDAALEAFGRSLYGGELFASLLRMVPVEVAPAAPTVAFLVHDVVTPGDRSARVYDLTEARFVESHDTRPEAFAATCECFARDLLETLTVARSPGYTVFGRMRFHARPQRERLELDMALYVHAHPLRDPSAFAAIYRRQLDALGPRDADVPAR